MDEELRVVGMEETFNFLFDPKGLSGELRIGKKLASKISLLNEICNFRYSHIYAEGTRLHGEIRFPSGKCATFRVFKDEDLWVLGTDGEYAPIVVLMFSLQFGEPSYIVDGNTIQAEWWKTPSKFLRYRYKLGNRLSWRKLKSRAWKLASLIEKNTKN